MSHSEPRDSDGHVRWRLIVQGTVQGVGFRPFVHRLARRHDLSGYVLNDGHGVQVEVQGAAASVRHFVEAVQQEAPPLAVVRSVDLLAEMEPEADDGFAIRSSISSTASPEQATVPPDVATCPACLEELEDPQDRRYRYPFVNCTDCGPRYTIISGVPYDRPLTTMRGFELCPECRAEYEEISCRRYHAQPIACPACGPQVRLVDREGRPITCDDPIARTIQLLEQGQIGAVKGLGGFHLACDATSDRVVALLRRRKRRPHRPFAVMARDLAAVAAFAELTAADREILSSYRRPILLLPLRQPSPLSAQVGGASPWVGTMLPYTPLHQLLLDGTSCQALVMTSGNHTDEPIVHQSNAALERLGEIADFFLLNDRPILARADDSVVMRMIDDPLPTFVRRSRGYVPEPVVLPRSGPSALATGGDLKNTCCVTSGALAILSQHIGDLEHPDAADLLCATAGHLQDLFGAAPELVVHDLHPDYHSTRLAESLPLPRLAIQHHHAHGLACLADNGCTEPALAIALDGTGYGTDGQVWGGEILLVDGLSFSRLAHLRYLPLPGGQRAIEQPWRMATAALAAAFGGAEANARLRELPPGSAADPAAIHGVLRLATGAEGVLTSSAGRLFDAAASLLGICHHNTFEGQAAMQLEHAAAASAGTDSLLPFDLIGRPGEPLLVDLIPAFAEMARLVQGRVSTGAIARLFHNTLCAAVAAAVCRLREETALETVALSGGVLQNRIVHHQLVQRLRGQGCRVLVHRQVSPNDSGLALGQAWAGLLQLTLQRTRPSLDSPTFGE